MAMTPAPLAAGVLAALNVGLLVAAVEVASPVDKLGDAVIVMDPRDPLGLETERLVTSASEGEEEAEEAEEAPVEAVAEDEPDSTDASEVCVAEAVTSSEVGEAVDRTVLVEAACFPLGPQPSR